MEAKTVAKSTAVFKNGLKLQWLGHAAFRITSPNGIRMTMVYADHSSGITDGDRVIDGGTVSGFVMRNPGIVEEINPPFCEDKSSSAQTGRNTGITSDET
ncbi:MAG: hypothetical protein M1469_09550 [Bacteroidetes bacterium]|nr:hypothetical protein [Bacteroidota bacterium]